MPARLEQRLARAMHCAATALRLAAVPPDGLDLSALEAPLDKVVAEVAILAREAASCPGGANSATWRDLARQLTPLARAPRIRIAVALRPSVALDLTVGHILLAEMGEADAALSAVLESACASPLAGARERLPHRALEQHWLSALAGIGSPPGMAEVAPTVLCRGLDLPGASRDDLYALTHAVAYTTDFGRWPMPAGVDTAGVLALCESALAITLDDDDFDLAAELVMAWPCLRTALSPVACHAFGVLCAMEDAAGILPSLTLRRTAVEAQPPRLREAHTVVTSYHTALVMGLACALLLRAGVELPDAGAASLDLGSASPDRGAASPDSGAASPDREGGRQWEGVAGATAGFRRDVALKRALRRADLGEVWGALAAGVAAGVPASPLALQAAQMLGRLGAMDLALVA